MSAQRSPSAAVEMSANGSHSLRFTIRADHWDTDHESRHSECRVVVKKEEYANDREGSGEYQQIVGDEERSREWEEAAGDCDATADPSKPDAPSGARRGGNRRRRIHFEISELQQLYHLPLKTVSPVHGTVY